MIIKKTVSREAMESARTENTVATKELSSDNNLVEWDGREQKKDTTDKVWWWQKAEASCLEISPVGITTQQIKTNAYGSSHNRWQKNAESRLLLICNEINSCGYWLKSLCWWYYACIWHNLYSGWPHVDFYDDETMRRDVDFLKLKMKKSRKGRARKRDISVFKMTVFCGSNQYKRKCFLSIPISYPSQWSLYSSTNAQLNSTLLSFVCVSAYIL